MPDLEPPVLDVPETTLALDIQGMTCASCVRRVERALASVDGVLSASVNLATERATVRVAKPVSPEELVARVAEAGYEARVPEEELELAVTGMTCASCVARVERALRRVPGVREAAVNLATERAYVRFDSGVRPAELLVAVAEAGYEARPLLHEETGEPQGDLVPRLRRLAVGVLLTAVVLLLTWLPALSRFPTPATHNLLIGLVALPVWLYVGATFHRGALVNLRHGSANMDTLVSLGSTVAFVYSAVVVALGAHAPVYFDTAAFIVTLIFLGKVLESLAKGQASAAIRALAGLKARVAHVRHGTETVDVPADVLTPGDVVLVRPGERIPADGVVLDGTSAVDESLLSGESLPIPKASGDAVIGGSINGSGVLTVEVQRVGRESTLGTITRIVSEAQTTKAPAQRLADSIAAVFVPAVLAAALLTFVGWLLLGRGPVPAMVAAVAVLVVACPCALGLAIPIAVMVGTGHGASHGILIRNGEVLERMHRVDLAVLDKTGTVTAGRPAVVDLFAVGEEAEVLTLVASAEAVSEHPLAAAVVAKAREEGLGLLTTADVTAHPGAGIEARVAGHEVLVGSADFLAAKGVPLTTLTAVATARAPTGAAEIYAAIDGEARLLLWVADPLRPEAAEVVAALRRLGLEVLLLSGDRREAAEAVAERLGIPRVQAEVRPEQKAEVVAALQRQGHRVLMVGDGVNDAPALASADVGVAMATGTDVAMAVADVTLARGDLRLLPKALRLARATYAILRQNLFWALIYNVVLIPLAAVGILNPMWAAVAMALSSVSVVSNALRLRLLRL